MEFPLTGLIEMNSSGASTDGDDGPVGSLYRRKPLVAAVYVGVLGVATVVGTIGNLVVVATTIVKQLRRSGRNRTTSNDVGWAFIANLASSDLIVTAVINPMAIAGLSVTSAKDVMFTPVSVCLSVCLSVSRITKKTAL